MSCRDRWTGTKQRAGTPSKSAKGRRFASIRLLTVEGALIRKPALVAHADWSKDPKKRCADMAVDEPFDIHQARVDAADELLRDFDDRSAD